MARTKKNAEGSRTPKSKMTVVQKKAPVAKKTFKGNAKTIVASIRHSKRTPKKIVRFTESIPFRERGKRSSKKRLRTISVAASVATKRSAVKAPKRTPPISVKPLSKKEKVPEKTSKKRHKNDLLVRRDNIENMSSNCYFYGKNAPKFVSVNSYGRVAYRFVLRRDLNGLKQAANDKVRFHSEALKQPYAEAYQLSPEGEAVLSEDLKFIDAVLQLSWNLSTDSTWIQSRARPQQSLLSMVSTGQQNYHMLGHATANIEMTRGGREGNNALLCHDVGCSLSLDSQVEIFLEKNVSFTTLEHIASLDIPSCQGLSGYYASKIVHAVRYGNRKLAGKLIETYSSYNFNDLHTQTLLNDHQPLKKFKPISVLKKGQMNCSITPIHTAAINPNVAYLKALMAVEPNFNVPDTQNWYTIHYAAVCEGTGPLKLLLDMGTPIVLLNKSKDLPLHCAARAGRAENVKLLLEAMQKAKEASRTNDEGPDAERSQAETDDERGDAPGPARKKPKIAKMKGNASMVNAKAQNGMTPLHMAAEKGHEEVMCYTKLMPCYSTNDNWLRGFVFPDMYGY